MVRIVQDPDDWQAGYDAGMSGGSFMLPPEVGDRLAYAAGFIEGRGAVPCAGRGCPGRRPAQRKPLKLTGLAEPSTLSAEASLMSL
jgi:hypothetical protein